MTFSLGAPEPYWISISRRDTTVGTEAGSDAAQPSVRHAQGALGHGIVDSGAYELITRHGRHLDTPEQYVRAVRSYDVRIGNLPWHENGQNMTNLWLLIGVLGRI